MSEVKITPIEIGNGVGFKGTVSISDEELKNRVDFLEQHTKEFNELIIKTENELYIRELLQRNENLKQELDKYKNKVEYYENFEINKTIDKIRLKNNKEIKELHQKLDQYKNNWEELKKWLKEETERLMKIEKTNNVIFLIGAYDEVLNKVKELEEDK